jgi:oligopeptide/dipeptide ABC transporter ATP-binding protein
MSIDENLVPLLAVRKLSISFRRNRQMVTVVDDLDFDIQAGQSVALVGESGSGKSVTALSILRLLETMSAKIEAEQIGFKGRDLTKLSEKQIESIRGNEISMIFQEPMTSLNPTLRIGFQIAEAITLHQKLNRHAAKALAIDALEKVGISDATERARQYPHQMSGGMRQRVMIAMALACRPDLLIADEPTSALDVTIQAQILRLIQALQAEFGSALLLITHDLGVVASVTTRVAVMYAGQIVEDNSTEQLFNAPLHPYTQGLLKATPSFSEKIDELFDIPGSVPNPDEYGDGCRFAERCTYAKERCFHELPALVALTSEQRVRCHYPLTGK